MSLITTLPTNVTYAARVRLVRRRRAQPHRQRMVEALEAFLDWLEDARQYAVERLDELNGDPDFEPNLGGYMGWDRERECYISDEAEDDDREEDRSDGEPALGAPEDGPGGCRWGGGTWHVTGEEEASLGSLGGVDQRRWAAGDLFADALEVEDECDDEGADTDREPDCDDEGGNQASCMHFMHEGRPVWPPAGTVLDGSNGGE